VVLEIKMNSILSIVTLAWLLDGEVMNSKNCGFTLKWIKPVESSKLKRTETVAYS
jgi:hypothetical protein